MLLLSRIGTAKGNMQLSLKAGKLQKQDCTIKRDCTITVLNQNHKLRNIKMKRLCMVKQKTVETLQI